MAPSAPAILKKPLFWAPVLTAVLLLLLLPAIQGTTVVQVAYGGFKVYAEVNGTRLEIPADDLPPGFASSPSAGIRTGPYDPPESSLYWQPAQDNLLRPLGVAGEWLQQLRPAASWSDGALSAAGGVVTYTASLRGGRTPASISVLDGNRELFHFVIRAERRNISWWSVDNGAAAKQLNSAIYRPSGLVSLADLATELALIGLAALVLALLAWATGLLVRWFSRPRADARVAAPGEDSLLSTRLDRLAPLVLFVLGTVLTSIVCLGVLDGIPHVQDDVAYLFQARIFAHGRSWVPVPPGPEFFANGFIQMFEGRWFTKYPPGYPLLLVPALWAGVSWLVNPMSAGVALALVYLTARRMYNRHVAIWAGVLGITSPWLLFMSGSYMSHPTTMMWAALFVYCIVRMRDQTQAITPRAPAYWLWPLLGGVALGMAFITREWTAIGIGVGAAIWALGDLLFSPGAQRLRLFGRYCLLVAGFVPPLIFLLYENKQLTGDWFRLAQDLVGSYDQPGFGPGHGDAQGHTPALGVYNTVVYLRTLATVFDGWPAPLALAPLLLGLLAWIAERTRRHLRWDALNWLCALGLIAAYFAWWSSTTIYGPRYWYEAMPFFLMIAARGLDMLGRLASGASGGAQASRLRWLVPAGLLLVLGLYNVSQTLPFQVEQYRDYNGISASALREAEGANLKNALVFVALDPAKPNRDYGKVFFANDPLLQGDRVYARDMGPNRNKALAGQFPNRTPYYLPLSGPPRAGFGP